MENDFHSIGVSVADAGFRADCTCGWRGAVQTAPTGRQAFGKAREDGQSHWVEVQRQRAHSASGEPK